MILTKVKIDNHYNGTPQDIDRITLNDLWNSLSHYQQTIMNLIAYTGLRPQQLYETRLDQIKPITETYSILDYSQEADKFQVKTKLMHYTFIPTAVIEPSLQYAKQAKRTALEPQYHKHWTEITELARIKFKVHITAKYFRQRFKTIAESQDVPANIFNWLDGSTPDTGANALNYAQTNKIRFLRIYDQLTPYLSPTSTLDFNIKADPHKDQLDRIENLLKQLTHTNASEPNQQPN